MRVKCDCGHEFSSDATMPTCPECHKRFRASSHEVAIHHDTPTIRPKIQDVSRGVILPNTDKIEFLPFFSDAFKEVWPEFSKSVDSMFKKWPKLKVMWKGIIKKEVEEKLHG